MEWRIRESGHGGFIAELVGVPEQGTPAGFKPGFIMGAVLYETARFDTKKQAEKYIARRIKEGRG